MPLAIFGRCALVGTNSACLLFKSFSGKCVHTYASTQIRVRRSQLHVPACNFSCFGTRRINAKTPVSESSSPTHVYHNPAEQESITGGNPDLETKLRILCLEHDVMRQEGLQVPKVLTIDQWKQVLSFDSRAKRRKYYKYLFGIEAKKMNDKLKKEKRLQEWLEKKATIQEENTHIKYGIGYNTFLLRVYDTTINQLYNHNVIRAMQFGQKIVIDCGYDNHMIPQESSNCAKQIMLAFSENRMHVDPFDLHLCNAQKDSPTMKGLKKFIPNVYDDYFPLNVSEQSYLDLFPKQNLVYLTPHCRTELHEFDHDAVYIVGGMVDKVNSEPLSLAKAKREGLRMAKLPLDMYLHWGSGSGKSLTINQMLNIMLDFRLSEDWDFALRHVPRRKIRSEESYSSQRKVLNNKTPEQKQYNTRNKPHKLITPVMFDTSC